MADPAPPVRIGDALPLGATVRADGVNFSLFSQHATLVELLFFDRYDDPEPQRVIRLDASHHRTFSYWHAFVPEVGAGQIYGYRVHGPYDPARGMRFESDKVLVDPYAKGIVYGDNWSREEARRPGPNVQSAMKSLVVDPRHFDWQGTQPPDVRPTDRIIYEMHVRGFTRHPSSGTSHPGTFHALIEKIPYLVDLGITTVQLMPVFQFDESEVDRVNPRTGEQLVNYWGYDPLGFFAPHRHYYIEDWRDMRYLTGFRDLVRALHAAGLEVFLDVVLNHTAEGDETGPTISFRGIDNKVYYLLDPQDRGRYADFSGCGNTLNVNHPMVRRLILDALRYWVEVMRIDGFRFDLASVLSRDEQGKPMRNPPIIWEIESDPVLSQTTVIAEAWDAAGLYQVGHFPGERWGEWNGRFRDDVRRFVRGDPGALGNLAARLTGSADLYERHGREPHQSVNYVTSHDGFTLWDLVSYERKHNRANGEGNRDGFDQNFSHNHGVEGPTSDPGILALRTRQAKNLLLLNLLAHGTPMLRMGDEILNSQQGNNNAYCQDNEISWLDWSDIEEHAGMLRFTRLAIRLRKAHPNLRPRRYATGPDALGTNRYGRTTVRWHGTTAGRPDWSPHCHLLAYTLQGAHGGDPIHVVINGDEHDHDFEIPPPPGDTSWHRAVDTARASPEDILPVGEEAPLEAHTVEATARSVQVYVAR